jgi:hypothetical protein
MSGGGTYNLNNRPGPVIIDLGYHQSCIAILYAKVNESVKIIDFYSYGTAPILSVFVDDIKIATLFITDLGAVYTMTNRQDGELKTGFVYFNTSGVVKIGIEELTCNALNEPMIYPYHYFIGEVMIGNYPECVNSSDSVPLVAVPVVAAPTIAGGFAVPVTFGGAVSNTMQIENSFEMPLNTTNVNNQYVDGALNVTIMANTYEGESLKTIDTRNEYTNVAGSNSLNVHNSNQQYQHYNSANYMKVSNLRTVNKTLPPITTYRIVTKNGGLTIMNGANEALCYAKINNKHRIMLMTNTLIPYIVRLNGSPNTMDNYAMNGYMYLNGIESRFLDYEIPASSYYNVCVLNLENHEYEDYLEMGLFTITE